jgi:choline transport protein
MWYEATRSQTAATVFVVLLCCAAVFALIGAQQTASRLTWSLARDRAIIGSQWLSEIHPVLEVPVWSLLFNFVVMFIIGCIYLGSSSAFNAFIGSGLVLQHISYAFPAALLMYRKRSEEWLPASRSFRLPNLAGWTVNVITIGFALLVLVFYDLPTVLPVTGSNMNYTSAVLGVMAIFGGLNWVIYARKKYDGPRLGHSGE